MPSSKAAPTKPAAKKTAPPTPPATSALPEGIHVVPAKMLDELVQHGLKTQAGDAL